MPETVLQELNRRFPFTTGLQGEALVEAIAANQDDMDMNAVWHMFKRLASFAANEIPRLVTRGS